MSHYVMFCSVMVYFMVCFVLSQAVLQTHRALFAQRQNKDPSSPSYKTSKTRGAGGCSTATDGIDSTGTTGVTPQSTGEGNGQGRGGGGEGRGGGGLSCLGCQTIVFYCYEYGNAWWGQWGPSNVRAGGTSTPTSLTTTPLY